MKKSFVARLVFTIVLSSSLAVLTFAQSADSAHVKFNNSHQTIQFGGTLSYPENTNEKVPAVIIV